MNRFIIAVLFLLSGAAGLIYQVVWSRSLTLLFGSTTLAVSTVVTAFMAGLGLGSWLFGRYADRLKKTLPLYAILEIGIAVAALLFPVFLDLLKPAFLWLSRNLSGSYLLFPLGRFLLCFLGLLPPTLLMGGTLPAMTRFFVRERASFGGNVSTLYALNTFGAMAGCFAAGFFLIPSLGIGGTVTLAVALNLAAAVGALIVSRTERPYTGGISEEVAAAAQEEANRSGERTIAPGLVLFLFAVAGFTSLAYEVLWTRALLFFLGWFAVYAFTIILSSFLFGIAAGSAVYPILFRRGRNLLIAFAVIEIIIGVFGALSAPILGNLFEVIGKIEEVLPSDNWWRYIFARAGGSFAVMLIPTFLMGLAFPIASALYARSGRGYGATVGNVYASNTVGSILGAMLAGFMLLPLLGLGRSLAFLAIVNLILGGAILLARAGGGRGRGLAIVATILLAALGVANFASSNGKPLILTSRHFKNENRPMRLLYASEGSTASLAVLHDVRSGHYELNINGESTAYTTYTDMQVHLMLSHLPLVIPEDPKKVLVIGFGLGSTSYGATLHPSVEQVRCIELVPKEVETAEYFENVNHGVLRDPKFDLVIDDGRTYVFRTDEKYDLISFNAIHPSHSPALYTHEFYEECSKKLTENGVICAWVPNNSFTERQFQILLRTFQDIFPHSSMWYVNPNHLVVIGTQKKLSIDFDEFRRKLNAPPVRSELARYTMDDPYQMLAYHLMDEIDLERYTRGVPINTDSKPYLEYSRELKTRPEIIDAMQYHRSSVLPYLVLGDDSAAVIDTLRLYEKAAYHLLAAQAINWIDAKDPDVLGRIWRVDTELAEARRETPWQENLHAIGGTRRSDEAIISRVLENQPDFAEAQQRLLRLYRVRGEWDRVAESLQEIRGEQTTSAAMAQALLLHRDGEWKRSERFFHAVAGGDSPVLRNAANRYIEANTLESKRDAGTITAAELCDLGDKYWTVGDRERGESVFREAIELHGDGALPWWRFGRALEQSYRLEEADYCFTEALHRPLEREDLRKYLESTTNRIRMTLAMDRNPNRRVTVEGSAGEVLEVDPSSAEFRFRLGLAFLEGRMVERASMEFRIATMLDGNHIEARRQLARTYAIRGLMTEARQELEIALDLSPDRADLEEELDMLNSR